MVLISKPFEVEAWRRSGRLCLRSPFRVCRGLQAHRLIPENIGMCSKKKCVESVRQISLKVRYVGDFLRKLQPADSAYAAMEFNRMPATVYVASTFGLIAGLLRQKCFPPNGLVNSPVFMAAISMLNSVILDSEPDRAKDLPFGSKTHENIEELGALLVERTARIKSLESKPN